MSELKQQMQDGKAPIIIDVRDEDEYLAGHIPGAIMVPAKQMEHHLDMMEQYRKEDIVLFCGCGATRTPPHCDGAHIGLRDREPWWQRLKSWFGRTRPRDHL